MSECSLDGFQSWGRGLKGTGLKRGHQMWRWGCEKRNEALKEELRWSHREILFPRNSCLAWDMIEEAICILTVPLSVVVGEERGKEEENNLKSANKAAARYLLNKSCSEFICMSSSPCPNKCLPSACSHLLTTARFPTKFLTNPCSTILPAT